MLYRLFRLTIGQPPSSSSYPSGNSRLDEPSQFGCTLVAFVRRARRGTWEKLFRELAEKRRSTDMQMIIGQSQRQPLFNICTNAPIVRSFDTSHIRRQARLDPAPLLIVSQTRFLRIPIPQANQVRMDGARISSVPPGGRGSPQCRPKY
jgi:hypothetical protein